MYVCGFVKILVSNNSGTETDDYMQFYEKHGLHIVFAAM